MAVRKYPKRYHYLSEGEKRYCFDLWMARYTLSEIAQAVDASVPSVHRAVKEQMPPKAKIAPYREVKELYEGFTHDGEIGSENG